MSEKPVTLQPRSAMAIGGRIAMWVIVGVVLSFTVLMASALFLFQLPYHLALGWLFHAAEAIPPLLPSWPKLMLPAGALIVATWLMHRFIQWSLASKGTVLEWRPGQTVAVVSLVLLGSAAAIAMSGVIHQGVWLLGEPWVENRGKKAYQTVAVSNGRQLMLALFGYQTDHGHYPDSLYELEEIFPQVGKTIWIKTRSGGVAEPFVFLTPGAGELEPGQPVLMSPVLESPPCVIVGYADMSVTRVPLSQLKSGRPGLARTYPPPTTGSK